MNYFFIEEKNATEFIKCRYLLHNSLDKLPLKEESSVAIWRKVLTQVKIIGLAKALQILSDKIFLVDISQTTIWLEDTAVGTIPIVFTKNRRDFIHLAEIFSAKHNLQLPDNINSFIIKTQQLNGESGNVILLGDGGYSSVKAKEVFFAEQDWLDKSKLIRLYHECTHYFIWRLSGLTQSHPLDELIADCIGQIRAFGKFSAELQKKFFGLNEQGKYIGGRLYFYCSAFSSKDFGEICNIINLAINNLDIFLKSNPCFLHQQYESRLIILLAEQGLYNLSKNIFCDTTCQAKNKML